MMYFIGVVLFVLCLAAVICDNVYSFGVGRRLGMVGMAMLTLIFFISLTNVILPVVCAIIFTICMIAGFTLWFIFCSSKFEVSWLIITGVALIILFLSISMH